MTDVSMEELFLKYSNLTSVYFENNASELHKMADKVLRDLKFHDVDKEEFYSLASEVFVVEVLKHFDESQDFEGFLYSCLYKKFCSSMTRSRRKKRCTRVKVRTKDSNGNVVESEEIIPDVRMDAPLGDGENTNFGDLLKSSQNIEEDVFGDMTKEKVLECLSHLPKTEKTIIEMKMEDIPISVIKSTLGLSDSRFNDCMKSIRENRSVISFNSKKNEDIKGKKVEDKKVNENSELSMENVMDLDTTDSYRTDKQTLGSLLDDIDDELSPTYINRDYISQRQPFMWDEEKINKYYSRILNNQPIPEIVICEANEEGEKVSYLIDGLQRLSYADIFKKNLIPIKANGAEFVNIKYKKKVTDENGKVKTVEDIFNIVGKYYKDLPDFLKKRFNNFNVSVTRFFDCTSEMIDYHIRNYNNHVAMNKSQYSMTTISNETAKKVKGISQMHSFFKDNVKATNKNRKDGSWDEVVARTIMTMNFIDDWKKEVKDVLKFVNINATTEQFEHLKSNLDRLTLVADKAVQDLFTTTNTHVWLAVFDKFTELNLEDVKFIEFMKAFKTSLHNKKVDGKPFDDVYKDKGTRDKKVVSGKINGLVELMYEFLHINKEDLKEVDVLDFVKENVNSEITEEDITDYKEDFEILTLDIDNSSKLLEERNLPSLIAIIAYTYKEDIRIDKWLVDFFKQNNTYTLNQKQNYLHMKKDLDNYIELNKGKVQVA